jgi:hypothetical protein
MAALAAYEIVNVGGLQRLVVRQATAHSYTARSNDAGPGFRGEKT